MRTFRFEAHLFKQTNRLFFITFLLMLTSIVCRAQLRTYSIVYSDNIRGSSTMFGNTLLHIMKSDGTASTTKMNNNQTDGNSIYGNDDENMQNIDIDGTTGNGSVTRNSSSADLALPGGTNTIKLARLYWGGRITNSDFDLTKTENRQIKIRKGTSGAYADVTALGMDMATVNTNYTQYQAYADVTSLITTGGAGTYEVGNAPLSVGKISGGGNNGGWCIVVVYENNSLNYNSVRVYDGFEQVFNNQNPLVTSATLTGLNVPSGALSSTDAKMGVVTWEGDANLTEDFLKINGNLFSNATNPSNNPWNGTITNNGVHVTAKNPNYSNQMGIDIDQFNVGTGYGILPNATSVTLEFGTEKDQYFPGLFTFTISMKDPTITVEKTVADANRNNLGERNEVLTYTLKGKNNGIGNANSIVINDTLTSAVTYVPNSLKVISCQGVTSGTKTDASGDDNAEYIVNGSTKTVRFRLGSGCNNTLGGTLASAESYEVQFQVTVNDPGANKPVPSIMNIARISAMSDANVNFVDDGTAIINPQNGPLPVTLLAFTATLLQDEQVKLNWSTSMEINCSEYVVERSLDGKIFYEVSSVKGSGTTSTMHTYSAIDMSSDKNSIVYYRLKQLDLDKKANYSNVIAVKFKSLNSSINVSPNPFTSYLNINMEWNSGEVITAKVINSQGKEVVSKNLQMYKGHNYVSIDELARLPAGNYFIQFISSVERITKKISKQ